MNSTENPVDPKAAIIFTLERVGGQQLVVLYHCYDGPTPPKGAFKKFETISSLIDQTKTRTYKDLVSSSVYQSLLIH
jgi:hypothetical protein